MTLPNRGQVARARAASARSAWSNCRLCDFHCGVNREAGEKGSCRAGNQARVFSAQVEVSDELEFVPTFAIAFSGCDLRCAFCITGKESWNAEAGELSMPAPLARRAIDALARGARSIMILGGEPAVHLPAVFDLVAHLPDDARLLWKTNAHSSAEARELLDGIFDVWIADYKFGNDDCAERLALAPNYTRTVRDNLVWAQEHTELLVRHLIMPGHVECCWVPVARWIAESLPGVQVNLRSGFWPAWQSGKHEELRSTVSQAETELAWQTAAHYNLNLVQ